MHCTYTWKIFHQWYGSKLFIVNNSIIAAFDFRIEKNVIYTHLMISFVHENQIVKILFSIAKMKCTENEIKKKALCSLLHTYIVLVWLV